MKKTLVIVATVAIALVTLFAVSCKNAPKVDPEAKSVMITKLKSKANKDENVEPAELKSIELKKDDVFIIRVARQPLNAKIKYQRSSDENVAIIKNNTITAIGAGEAKITVAVGRNNLEATLDVKVVNPAEAN